MAFFGSPSYCGTAAPLGCGTTYAPYTSGTVDAYGKPVYKKKWLFGKWKYAGLRDVHYVPRPAALPLAHHHDVHVETHCSPVHVDTHCGPAFGACATGFDAHCATPAWGGACATGFDGHCF